MFGIPLAEDWEPTPGFWQKPMMYMCANVLEPGTCNYDLGMYQIEDTWALVEYFLSEFHKREILNPEDGKKVDAIFVNGDNNAHGLTYRDYVELHLLNQNGDTTEFMERMKKTQNRWTHLYQLIANATEHQIPILPTFGNNDMVVHSQANTPELKKFYLPIVYDIWFKNQKVKPADPATFLDGGYYRYDFEGRALSLLAMNTVMYMRQNREYGAAMQNQMDWLEATLKQNAELPVAVRKQFMISMHVFPGLNYFGGVESLWLPDW